MAAKHWRQSYCGAGYTLGDGDSSEKVGVQEASHVEKEQGPFHHVDSNAWNIKLQALGDTRALKTQKSQQNRAHNPGSARDD